MKNLMTIATVILSLFFVTGCDKETLLSEKEIPSEIKTYVETHFPTSSISRAVKDKDGTEMFEITLANGVKLEFNMQKEVIDIDWHTKLPDSVIPPKILSYVNSNYSTSFIIGWELQSGNQEIQLNNNLALVFNMTGEFLRVKD